MLPEVPNLANYLAKVLHVDLHNYVLQNMDEAAFITKQEKELHKRKIDFLVQAELAALILHDREKLLRVLQVVEPTRQLAELPGQSAAD